MRSGWGSKSLATLARVLPRFRDATVCATPDTVKLLYLLGYYCKDATFVRHFHFPASYTLNQNSLLSKRREERGMTFRLCHAIPPDPVELPEPSHFTKDWVVGSPPGWKEVVPFDRIVR